MAKPDHIKKARSVGMLIAAIFLCGMHTSSDQGTIREVNERPLAFPGAEGFGKYTTGGRGGSVLLVTNLNDHGPGSLRDAIEKDFPRTILFEVSGTIDLESDLEVNNGNLTIAGQSAPGDGICWRNYPMKVKASNVIIRYVRGRLGDQKGVEDDAISIIGQKDIIIDHCSFSWGTDEVASFYDNRNFTLQWSIISESLNKSVHSKGEHGYGGIWGGMGATFHHNLLAHHKSRNPRFCGARYHKQPKDEVVDFRNNVIYNWRSNTSYGGEEGNHNIVNNYYKPGPATPKSKQGVFLDPWSPYGKFYVMGNVLHGSGEVTQNNRLGITEKEQLVALTDVPFEGGSLPGFSGEEAYIRVLSHAGCLSRDEADERIVGEVQSGTGIYGKLNDGIIDSQNDTPGWPVLKSLNPLADQDRDGMPDDWEKKQSLNPKDASDSPKYGLSEVYTNLEVYLNGLLDGQIK